ncbi:nucleotidyltransferase [Bacteroidia bacterium]|nr:nucleotidyltransferase [Bacteroidia bacterium]GHV42920.1 nucleotidyltransferase [Bacteroidia bacterium]
MDYRICRSALYYEKSLNTALKNRITKILQQSPVQKAWLFGSYANGTATKNSDIDIIVQFLPNKIVTLFDIGGIIYNLEEMTGKKIDLVEDGYLLPYAEKTASKEKILLYERSK